MAQRKTTSITFRRLTYLTLFSIGIGFACWYIFIRPNSSSPIHLQPLPKGFLSHGIDVSHHQGTIDWDLFFEYMDTTVSFVYCKVSEGTHFNDSQWNRNHSILAKSKLKHGGYHFFTPDISGEMQAAHFLNQYTPTKNELQPVLDAEVPASTDSRLVNGMKEWLKAVEERTSIRPIIYTSYSMYRDKLKGKFPGYQFWIASYNPTESRVQDAEIIHWQYSDRGTVPGITGMVDLNFSKLSFRPSMDRAN